MQEKLEKDFDQWWLLEMVQLWWEQMGRILSIGEELFHNIIQGKVYIQFAKWFVNLVQVWRHDSRIFGEYCFGWVCGWRIAIIYVRAHRMSLRIMNQWKKNHEILVIYFSTRFNFLIIMCRPCHFVRASNDEFSVEFWTFVLIIFFSRH